MTTRRIRAFKRWMFAEGIEHSDALILTDSSSSSSGISVFSNSTLKQGDLIATIPKSSCLTLKTTAASHIIQAAGFDGVLGLSFAVMYERSLGSASQWAGYLQLLPKAEQLPLVWSLDELDCLLCGTELHKTVKADKGIVFEDWKDCILPLVHSEEFSVDPKFFGVEDYFAAKSLVASRSFQIDDYHGCGMVPLADLFNHKTGAEDVHFTTTPSADESDDSADSVPDSENNSDELEIQMVSQCEKNSSVATIVSQTSSSSYIPNVESQDIPDNPLVLEMILVKDVKAGAEVFNTYGSMGNAALLHRYGFTEPDNPYDIINIDMELVLQWSSSVFTGRYTRARLSFWRNLGYSGCVSENCEYFEITYDGEPQFELLMLLYIILLPEGAYTKLELALAISGDSTGPAIADSSQKGKILSCKISEMSSDMLLTKSVCRALVSLADMRESLYGTSTLEHDIENLRGCNWITERKVYHSLVLRVSERRIIQKLRCHAVKGTKSSAKTLRANKRLKL